MSRVVRIGISNLGGKRKRPHPRGCAANGSAFAVELQARRQSARSDAPGVGELASRGSEGRRVGRTRNSERQGIRSNQ